MKSAATPELVPQTLSEYGGIVRSALADYLPSSSPHRYFYDLIAEYPRRGGKMMRPAICLAAARAFGAKLEEALHAAVSIELLHNALLIHDDIEDDSTERRGRPTLHVAYGIPLAINAGDGLTLLSLQPLLDSRGVLGPRLAGRVLEEAMLMAREVAEGQALELGWRQDNALNVDESDYLVMVHKKTCWLGMIFPTRVGALIGTRDGIDLEPFIRFGFFLGAAFQLQDDLLNFVADARYGKELAGDLWEGKRTPMLIRLLQLASPVERATIREILGRTREQRTAEQIAWLRQRMDDHGCIEYARRLAHGLAGAAVHEHSRAFAAAAEGRDKAFLKGLATWVFERTQIGADIAAETAVRP